MSKFFSCLAMIKLQINEGKNILEAIIPFISTLIINKKYKKIDVLKISQDFKNCYGFKIPYHPMVHILNNLNRMKLIKIVNTEYIPDTDELLNFNNKINIKINNDKVLAFETEFKKFAHEKHEMLIDDNIFNKIINNFLDEYDQQILLEDLPTNYISNHENFVFNNFVQYIFNNNKNLYNTLIEITISKILLNTVCYAENINIENKLNELNIYLDTRIILRLSGVEEEYRKEAYEYFINELNKSGAKLKVFKHTYNEITDILNDCINWIDNESYNSIYASPTLKYFVKNRYNKTDILTFISSMQTILNKNSIQIEEFNYEEKDNKYQVDENKLYELIIKIYKDSNHAFKEAEKEQAIKLDVRSIVAIYRMRNGMNPNILNDAKHIFVTTNTSLAKATKFYNFENQKQYFIHECMTDTFLGSMIWLNSPNKLEFYEFNKVISNCMAALNPSDALITKYINELNKLLKTKTITENEFVFLKSHQIAFQKLEDKTFGSADEFNDKMPEEILEEIKNESVFPILNELENELNSHKNTKKELEKTIEIVSEKETEISQFKDNISKISMNIANVITKIFLIFIIPGISFLLYYSQYNDIVSDDFYKSILNLINFIINLVFIYYGFSLKGIAKNLHNFLKNIIENFIKKCFLSISNSKK